MIRETSMVVLAVSLLAAASTASTARPSEDVRRRLAAGQVVVTDELPPGASETAHGGTAVAVMRASPEQVWRVIVDYPGHPRYYPHVTAADLVEQDERRAIVHYRVTVGPFCRIRSGAGWNGISPRGALTACFERTRATGRSTRRAAGTQASSPMPSRRAPCCPRLPPPAARARASPKQ